MEFDHDQHSRPIRHSGEARQLFSEARDVAEQTLAVAPNFNELRKELATSYEGLHERRSPLADRMPLMPD